MFGAKDITRELNNEIKGKAVSPKGERNARSAKNTAHQIKPNLQSIQSTNSKLLQTEREATLSPWGWREATGESNLRRVERSGGAGGAKRSEGDEKKSNKYHT